MTPSICAICGVSFERVGKSRRKTCSRSCQSALAWHKNPERRIAGISESKQRPEAQAILARRNQERWADPAEHAKLSRQNREQYKDDGAREERSRNIRAAWTPEKRHAASARKSEFWKSRKEIIA